jgi:hypothetical protein
MRATHAPDALWVCRIAYNDGMRSDSRMGCFTDSKAGTSWLGERSSGVKGQIYVANCMHEGRMMMNMMGSTRR